MGALVTFYVIIAGILLCLRSMNCVQEDYKMIIAVFNSSNEVNPNCSSGANSHYSINELPFSNISSGTLLKFCSKSNVLKVKLTLTRIEQIALVGYEFPELKCYNSSTSEAGFVFKDIHNLTIINMTIVGCGTLATVDPYPENNIKASVIIQTSTNITIAGLSIINSPGTGLAFFYSNGSVTVKSSVFEQNGYDHHSGGNGVYVETGPSLSSDFLDNGLSAEYIVDDCCFLYNIARTGMDNIIKGFSRYDKGGGMCVYILASERVNITVSNSLFIGNEADHYGGGLFVSYIGKSRSNNVRVITSEFQNNTGTYGGATYSGYLHTRLPVLETPLNCSHYYEFVNFSGNTAQFGGGSSIFASKTLNLDSSAKVEFENCSWKRNIGQYGAAVTVLPNAWNLYSEGYLPTPRLANCTISDNHVRSDNIFQKGESSEFSKGSGAFYCFGHNVTFEGHTIFEKNVGSAMYLGSCLGIFEKKSITYFLNNTGYQGGAIYELSSVVYVRDNSTLFFIGNTADDKGGAIYEHTFFMHIYDYSKTCFIDYVDNIEEVNDRNISVTFEHNFAAKYGHSIYASSLRPCYNRFSFSAVNLSVDIFDQVGNFSYQPPNRYMEVATAVNHSNITEEDWSGHLFFIPGKEISIPFVDVDDLDQPVMTSYLVTVEGGDYSNMTIKPNQNYLQISSNILVLYGSGNETATVTLSDTSSRQIALSFRVTVEACPPGFIHDYESQSCICAFNTNEQYVGIGACNLTLMRAYSSEGYWIGYETSKTETEDSLLSGYCPRGFCTPGKKHLLPEKADREELDRLICSESRTGILCGQCKQNFSVHFHSLEFNCKLNNYCNLGWLFYILSQIIPVTVIFLLIIFYNVPFTSGLVNGFIFYCQVVEVFQLLTNDLILFSESAKVVNKIHSFIYLGFTLNFFVLDELSFCLWKNANAVSIVAFNYVTLAFALLLIILVTTIIGKCHMKRSVYQYIPLVPKQKKSPGGIIHGLTAFLVLCYAQCAQSSLLLLISTTVYNKGSTKHKTMVYYDGGVEWMGVKHLPYAIPAIFLSLFVLILPPVLLLIYPIHNKVLSLLRIGETRFVQIFCSPLDKLKPFFDSFQSCFKDEFRFFSGLYFVYRFFIMLNLVISYLQDSFFFLEIQLVGMLLLHAVCQPYKERSHNVIDALLFGNLAAINAITYYNITLSATAQATVLSLSLTTWIQILLTILPLPIMLCCLFVRSALARKCWNRCRSRRNPSSIESWPDDDELPHRINYEACN